MLKKYRNKIDKIDQKIKNNLLKRLEIINKIKSYKIKYNLPILDKERENNHLSNLTKDLNGNQLIYINNNFKVLFNKSKFIQSQNKIGLIGANLKYSPSLKIHILISKFTNLNYEFENIEVLEITFNNILNKLKKGDYKAFFITMPYKKLFVNLVDFLTKEAYETKTINLIYYDGVNIIGHNTDTISFNYDFFKKVNLNNLKNEKVFVMGSGATSDSISYALKLNNIKYQKVSINNEVNTITYNELNKLNPKYIINTTPVGMGEDQSILISESKLNNIKYFYDCVNYPLITSHLKYVINGTNGFDMVIYQAIIGISKIYNLDIDLDKMHNLILKELK